MPRDSMHDSDTGEEEEDENFEDEVEPQVDRSLKHAIIVDGLPVVPSEKKDKLLNVVRKFYSQFGTIIENGLEMPFDAQGANSLGCARLRERAALAAPPAAEAVAAKTTAANAAAANAAAPERHRPSCLPRGAALPSSSTPPTRRRAWPSRRPTATSSTGRTHVRGPSARPPRVAPAAPSLPAWPQGAPLLRPTRV